MKREIIDRLRKMHLSSMANEVLRQEEENNGLLSFDERFAMIVNKEWDTRQEKKINLLIKRSNIKFKGAFINDDTFIDVRFIQGTKDNLLSLDWIDKGYNVCITGKTGSGKSFAASALGLAAIQNFYHVLYTKADLLVSDLSIASQDRRLKEVIEKYDKYDVLIIDDFGLMLRDEKEIRPLFELIDARETRRSTIVISQVPFENWYDLIGDATYADAILDRLLKYAYKLEFTGESKRKLK